VTKERARAIIASLPPFVTPVAVFADEPIEHVMEICRFCFIQTVQLHGDETPSYVSELRNLRRVKAVRLDKHEDLRLLARYTCEAFLLDAYVPEEIGGTGRSFNWEWAREAGTHGPIILAGGLNPDNVEEAIEIAHPCAVDVASGVESEPGKKDRKLMAVFIARAKAAVA